MKQFERKDVYESTFFQPEEKKLYTLMIGDGVAVKTNDTSGKETLSIPLICVNADNAQFNYMIFIPDATDEDWQKDQANRELNEIADVCGVWEQVSKEVPGDLEITSAVGLKSLCLRLPGKVFEGKFRIAPNKDKSKLGFPKFIYKGKPGAEAKGGTGAAASGGAGAKPEVWD